MKLLRLLLPLAALVSVAAIRLDDPTYSLVWKPTLGQAITYAVTVKFTGGDEETEMSGNVETKVTEVEKNGDYTLESRHKDFKIVVGKEPHDIPNQDEPDIDKYTAKGEKIPKKDTEDENVGGPFGGLLDSLEFKSPEKPVKKGDKWTHKIEKDEDNDVKAAEIEFEVKGEEKIGTYDVITINVKYHETEGDKPTTAVGSYSFDLKDMSTVKQEATVTYTPEEPGSTEQKIKFELTRK